MMLVRPVITMEPNTGEVKCAHFFGLNALISDSGMGTTR